MENSFIYGKNAVIEALEANNREFNRILISNTSRADEKIEKIKELARAKNIIFQFVGKEKLNQMAQEARHQGVIAQIAPIKYMDLDEFIDKNSAEITSVVILDGVEDSHNLGAIIRSCVAFGVDGLVVQDKNSPLESGAMVKATAGTMEHIKISRVTNLSRAIEILKDNGYWVIGMDGYADTTIDKVNKDGKIALVMGSEGKGMRRLVQENCDASVKLNISPLVESLNVSTAAAIAIYELTKGL